LFWQYDELMLILTMLNNRSWTSQARAEAGSLPTVLGSYSCNAIISGDNFAVRTVSPSKGWLLSTAPAVLQLTIERSELGFPVVREVRCKNRPVPTVNQVFMLVTCKSASARAATVLSLPLATALSPPTSAAWFECNNNNNNNNQTLRERALPWVLLPTPESRQG